MSFLSPQACHSWRRFLAQTRNPVTLYTSVSPRNPGVTLYTSVSFLSPQACHSWRRPGIQESPWIQACHSSCPHKCVIPVPTSVSFLSPQVCHSWRRPGIQESPWIQACHSCPHKCVIPGTDQESRSHPGYKCVIPVPTSLSFLAQTRNPGVTLYTSVSFLSPQACHSCPHKCVIPGADQESRSHPEYCVIPVPTSVSFLSPQAVSFLSPQACHSWRRPGIQESPCIQACHSCPHKLVIPGADQESRSHPVYKRVIPVPTSVSFLSPQVCHSWRRPGIQESPCIQVCHSCPHKRVIPGTDQESRSHPGYKCVIPGPTSVSFLSPQVCHSWRRPGIQESPWIQVCHSCPHKCVTSLSFLSRSHPVYKCVIPVPTSLSFLAQTRNPGVTLYTSVSFLSPQACHSWRRPGIQESPWIQVCHSCPHKRVIPVPTSCVIPGRPGIQESLYTSVSSPQVCHSCPHKCVIPVPTSVSFLAQTRNPGVTLDTSVSFLSPQVCHSWRRPGIQESPCIQVCHSCPHKRVIPGADQESRSHPGYKCVIPVPTSVSFLSPQACHSWHRPGIQESPWIQVCHSCPHKRVIPVPTSVSFLSPQACHSWRRPGIQESPWIQVCHSCPHKRVIPGADQESRSHPGYKRVIPGADQESRSHPGYKRVIPVPTSVSFLAQTRNPGVTLNTSVSFLSPQACHSWRRPGIQESPWIQVCHSCPHKCVIPGADQESRSHPGYKCVIPVPASVSFLAQTRNPGVTLDRVIPVPTSVSFLAQTRNPGVTLDGFLVCARNDNS